MTVKKQLAQAYHQFCSFCQYLEGTLLGYTSSVDFLALCLVSEDTNSTMRSDSSFLPIISFHTASATWLWLLRQCAIQIHIIIGVCAILFLTSSMRHPNQKLSIASLKRGLMARCFLVKNRVFVK